LISHNSSHTEFDLASGALGDNCKDLQMRLSCIFKFNMQYWTP
jgi:hypothetical protein